jgi:hypothetical protein
LAEPESEAVSVSDETARPGFVDQFGELDFPSRAESEPAPEDDAGILEALAYAEAQREGAAVEPVDSGRPGRHRGPRLPWYDTLFRR